MKYAIYNHKELAILDDENMISGNKDILEELCKDLNHNPAFIFYRIEGEFYTVKEYHD